MNSIPRCLIGALEGNRAIEVAWVYGSIARGDSCESSDIDLAVAFREQCADPWERVDALRAKLQGLQSQSVSIIDLNRAPTPLAYNVIQDGQVLICRNPLRLHAEQQRIWSLWGEYRGEHERTRSATPKADVHAIREQVAQHVSSLDELRGRLKERPLTFIERTAVERSLQIVIEAAIGCSKHLLRSLGRPVPAEARVAIERVFEATGMTDPALAEMRGAVGMRNAIIHDYLNLDWALLEAVLQDGRYTRVQDFVARVSSELLGDSSASE